MAQMMVANPKKKSSSKSTDKETTTKKKYKKRHNPKNDYAQYAMNIVISAGSALAINAGMSFIPLPDKLQKFKPLISILIAFGAGYFLTKNPKLRNIGMQLIEGVGTIETYNAGKMALNKVKPGLLSDGDDLESLLGESIDILGKNDGLIGNNSLIGAYERVGKSPITASSVVTDIAKIAQKKNNGMMNLSEYNYV